MSGLVIAAILWAFVGGFHAAFWMIERGWTKYGQVRE